MGGGFLSLFSLLRKSKSLSHRVYEIVWWMSQYEIVWWMSQRTGSLVKGGLEVVIECATREIYMVFNIHLSSLPPEGQAALHLCSTFTLVSSHPFRWSLLRITACEHPSLLKASALSFLLPWQVGSSGLERCSYLFSMLNEWRRWCKGEIISLQTPTHEPTSKQLKEAPIQQLFLIRKERKDGSSS